MKRVVVACACLFILAGMTYGTGRTYSNNHVITVYSDTVANYRDTGTVWLPLDAWNYKGYSYRVFLSKPDTGAASLHGFGKSDTAMIRFITKLENGPVKIIDSMTAKALMPCSLTVSRTSTTAGVDTLMKTHIGFQYFIADTTSDTAGIHGKSKIIIDVIVKE